MRHKTKIKQNKKHKISSFQGGLFRSILNKSDFAKNLFFKKKSKYTPSVLMRKKSENKESLNNEKKNPVILLRKENENSSIMGQKLDKKILRKTQDHSFNDKSKPVILRKVTSIKNAIKTKLVNRKERLINTITSKSDLDISKTKINTNGGNLLTQNLKEKIHRKVSDPKITSSLNNVKIHTGADSSIMAKKMNADAFTTGNHIHFAQNKFSPQTGRGMGLLVHELTHVGQQISRKNYDNEKLSHSDFQNMENEALKNEKETTIHRSVKKTGNSISTPLVMKKERPLVQAASHDRVLQKSESEEVTVPTATNNDVDIYAISEEVFKILEQKLEEENERLGG